MRCKSNATLHFEEPERKCRNSAWQTLRFAVRFECILATLHQHISKTALFGIAGQSAQTCRLVGDIVEGNPACTGGLCCVVAVVH